MQLLETLVSCGAAVKKSAIRCPRHFVSAPTGVTNAPTAVATIGGITLIIELSVRLAHLVAQDSRTSWTEPRKARLRHGRSGICDSAIVPATQPHKTTFGK